MSYLKQVMEMLGLEDMQEFEIEGYLPHRFNNGKLEWKINDGYNIIEWREYTQQNSQQDFVARLIGNLVVGYYTIKREWKPKNDDEFYTTSFDKNENLYSEFWWHSYNWQENLLKRGLVFETKEEAIECAKKMLEAIK